ncbi:MAG: hypothetical protein LUG50_04600, partial [Planctomycetaceae bacterium]|nr:hypothetical protein [Planctomycetaceae bacterium]
MTIEISPRHKKCAFPIRESDCHYTGTVIPKQARNSGKRYNHPVFTYFLAVFGKCGANGVGTRPFRDDSV